MWGMINSVHPYTYAQLLSIRLLMRTYSAPWMSSYRPKRFNCRDSWSRLLGLPNMQFDRLIHWQPFIEMQERFANIMQHCRVVQLRRGFLALRDRFLPPDAARCQTTVIWEGCLSEIQTERVAILVTLFQVFWYGSIRKAHWLSQLANSITCRKRDDTDKVYINVDDDAHESEECEDEFCSTSTYRY